MGTNWDLSYNQRILPAAATGASACNEAVFHTGDGSEILFKEDTRTGTPSGSGAASAVFTAPNGITLRLVRNGTGGWVLQDVASGLTRSFDDRGLLASIKNENGEGLTFAWTGSAPADYRLTEVVDGEGRHIEYSYTAEGFLREVKDRESGLTAAYTYVGALLDTATNSVGAIESYRYSPPGRDGGRDTVPEGALKQACELGCAPTGTRCGAGGGCPGAEPQNRKAWCQGLNRDVNPLWAA